MSLKMMMTMMMMTVTAMVMIMMVNMIIMMIVMVMAVIVIMMMIMVKMTTMLNTTTLSIVDKFTSYECPVVECQCGAGLFTNASHVIYDFANALSPITHRRTIEEAARQ